MQGSKLILIDLAKGRNALGATALAQVFNQLGDSVADADSATDLKNLFQAVQSLVADERVLAYHDRSDGGLAVTLIEMAIAGRQGISVDLAALGDDDLSVLFSEELGCVLQVAPEDHDDVIEILSDYDLGDMVYSIGATTDEGLVRFTRGDVPVLERGLMELASTWYELTSRMQALRDNPDCAEQEFSVNTDPAHQGIRTELTYDPDEAFSIGGAKPRMAILREQGINGQVEMGAAFDEAGFESVDVHMTDLLSGRQTLDGFSGLVACGGFSYGDVLGAGSGWGRSILFNPKLRDMFEAFFSRPDSFALGVCNGCQMMSQLKGIIPGAGHWPSFVRNRSEQFEARLVTVEVLPSPSIFMSDMSGSRIPVPVAHGEGRAAFASDADREAILSEGLQVVRYVDSAGQPTERYPLNPNGSQEGLTGVTTTDGRVTIMMPHPERAFRGIQLSYRPEGKFEEDGPWMRMFRNARRSM